MMPGTFDSREANLTPQDEVQFQYPPAGIVLLMRLLCIVALGISGFLAWSAYQAGDIAGCASSGVWDCGHVLHSHWSKVLGVPVSVPALGTYLAFFIALFFVGGQYKPRVRNFSWAIATLLAFAAAAAAIWFTSIQIFVLHHLCKYCVAAHAIGFTLCLIILSYRPIGRLTSMIGGAGLAAAVAMMVTQIVTPPEPTFAIDFHGGEVAEAPRDDIVFDDFEMNFDDDEDFGNSGDAESFDDAESLSDEPRAPAEHADLVFPAASATGLPAESKQSATPAVVEQPAATNEQPAVGVEPPAATSQQPAATLEVPAAANSPSAQPEEMNVVGYDPLIPQRASAADAALPVLTLPKSKFQPPLIAQTDFNLPLATPTPLPTAKKLEWRVARARTMRKNRSGNESAQNRPQHTPSGSLAARQTAALVDSASSAGATQSVQSVRYPGISATINPAQWPRLGSPHAQHFVIELFDYSCPHCRKMNSQLESALARYGDQIAIIAMPVPLAQGCNPAVKRTPSGHEQACELAQLALAVWRADKNVFPMYHRWLFASPKPRRAFEAERQARSIVDSQRLDKYLRGTLVPRFIDRHITLYRRSGEGALPKLLTERMTVRGAVNTPGQLFTALEQSLGIVPLQR